MCSMKLNLSFLVLFAVTITSCSTIKMRSTDNVFKFYQCKGFYTDDKGELHSSDAVCDCIIKKTESMRWSRSEICLLRNLSKEPNELRKCNVHDPKSEIKIFRPFVEKIMTIKGKCYYEVTGKRYPYY